MNSEIQDIIKKNLPEHVGQVLKDRLEQAEKDASDVKTLKQMVAERDNDLDSLKKIIAEYKEKDSRNAGLDAREAVLNAKETKFEVESLKVQLESEKHKSEFAESLAMGLVKNTTYKSTVFKNNTENGYTDRDGRWVDNKNNSTTIDKRTEEE